MEYKFHLSLPCMHPGATENFYTKILGASVGRKSDNWVDINLFDHQITFTKSGKFNFDFKNYRLGDQILPSFHFGLVVDTYLWGQLYSKLFKMNLEVSTEATFLQNKMGEHLSFFIKDPNGYMIEFKSFKNEQEIFMK